MTEQKEQQTEKKKVSIIKRIFKWLSLGLLTVLLIASIIFQAPWKVITLFAVILLACTILPKPYRKYFWLSAAGVVIALIIWVFLPEEDEGWRPYTFDKELAALKAKYAIPDEENAAIIYNQLLEDYNEATFGPNFIDPNLEDLTRKEPWSSKDHPEIAQWLKQHGNTIAKLVEASKIEKCRFPIVTDSIALGEHMKILAPMRRWAFLLTRAANNDLGEGRIDQALEKQIAVLQMGKHQCQQPLLIDFLVGAAIEALSTIHLNRFIVAGDATEEHLNLIEQALAEIKHDWSYDLPRIIEGEKLLAKNFLGMFYEVNPEGKVRLSRDTPAVIRAQFQFSQEIRPLTYWRRKIVKGGAILGWFYWPSTPQKAGRIIDESYEKYYAMAEPDFDWRKEPARPPRWVKLNFRFIVELLAGLLEKPYYSIHDIYLRAITQQRGSRLIVALRRYKNKNGNWPVSLDDIQSLAAEEIFVDPINGGPFIYKLTGENFTLYSKGKNNIDEDGKYKDGADDWPIWPAAGKKREAEKENTDAKQH
jgi:hypothetical protein